MINPLGLDGCPTKCRVEDEGSKVCRGISCQCIVLVEFHPAKLATNPSVPCSPDHELVPFYFFGLDERIKGISELIASLHHSFRRVPASSIVQNHIIQLYLVLGFFVDLAVFFESVGVYAKKDRTGNKINNMITASKPTMFLVEPYISSQIFETRVVVFCIICNEKSYTILDLVLIDYLTDTIGQILTAEKCTEFPFVVKEMYSEA
ncbi:hypothetical protein F4679DRAFT_577728 [Xylaria curta]|nr:hypothetical protein F4679DRAFT_577728 [Xylaria curta]